ncbi:unnamed protein product [Closterium sp. Naga37s-1]|nr:unnamed protein product [Closterium sp. Naga37s-1]
MYQLKRTTVTGHIITIWLSKEAHRPALPAAVTSPLLSMPHSSSLSFLPCSSILCWIFVNVPSSSCGTPGKHLAQHCRLEYPSGLNVVLWVIAEINVIASDIPQVVGTAIVLNLLLMFHTTSLIHPPFPLFLFVSPPCSGGHSHHSQPLVVGTAIALNLLFRIPLWAGVLITGCSALLLLALERFGGAYNGLQRSAAPCSREIRAEMVKALQLSDVGELFKGMVVPQLQNVGALAVAISILGATVMPHNLYLHSAIVLSRKHAGTTRAIRPLPLPSTQTSNHCSLLNLALALFLSLGISTCLPPDPMLPNPFPSPSFNPFLHPSDCQPLLSIGARSGAADERGHQHFSLLISVVISVAIIAVSGAVCHSASLPPGAAQACANISISNAHVLLTDVLGKWAGTLFGVALLAAGQSSTVTGTYAGQYVMQVGLGTRRVSM